MPLVVLVTFLLCAVAVGCRRPDSRVDSQAASVVPLFGPVISREVVGGRADDGRGQVWLLGGGEAIVRIDLKAGIGTRTPIHLSKGESCWGLARLDDGSLWTLRGRSTLVQVGAGGRVAREVPLPEPHFGLYARGDRLVYQPARFVQSGRLLFAGAPGDPHPEPWSSIEARSFPALARASAAALNMVACGATRTTELPCWFPDDTSLALVGADGTRRVALDGLTKVPPEVLLASENPARPLRDVFVDEAGSIRVLSSGVPPAGHDDQPGGWLLAEYTAAGALVRILPLGEPVRLILGADSSRLLVLTGAGMVAEVTR